MCIKLYIYLCVYIYICDMCIATPQLKQKSTNKILTNPTEVMLNYLSIFLRLLYVIYHYMRLYTYSTYIYIYAYAYIDMQHWLTMHLGFLWGIFQVDSWTTEDWGYRSKRQQAIAFFLGGTRPGKHTKNYGKSSFLMAKSTISMTMFSSFLYFYQRVNPQKMNQPSL